MGLKLTAETIIESNIDRVWALTQTPEDHVRWDLRFTDIHYLPKSESKPHGFRYITRLGFGLKIEGDGETVGQVDRQGSSLRFWSDDPKSLIRAGSGGWTYIQSENGVRFGTVYDYEVRYGFLGKIIDTLVFRPLMIWATRWSFDRLKLWIEKGIAPGISRRLWSIKVIARTCLGLVWIYEGLVPKILFLMPSEIDLVLRSALFWPTAEKTLHALGIAEVLLGLWIIFGLAERFTAFLATFILLILSCLVITTQPMTMADPLGGLSKNLGLFACAITVYLLAPMTPKARRAKPSVARQGHATI